MTDEVQAQAQNEQAAQAQAPVPKPDALSYPIYGFEPGDELKLLPKLYTVCLGNGMIMTFRLFDDAETFSAQVANGGVAEVATLGNIVRKEDGATAQAWVPFYVNTALIAGFSPVVHVDTSTIVPTAPADAAAGPDVV